MARPSRWTAARRWRWAAISISCATGPTPTGKRPASRSRRRTKRTAPRGAEGCAEAILVLRSVLLARVSKDEDAQASWFSRRCEASSGDGAVAPPHHEGLLTLAQRREITPLPYCLCRATTPVLRQ